MKELQIICPGCLRLRYGQGSAQLIPDGAIKSAKWYLPMAFIDPPGVEKADAEAFTKILGKDPYRRQKECDFCNHKFTFFWVREVPDTANH